MSFRKINKRNIRQRTTTGVSSEESSSDEEAEHKKPKMNTSEVVSALKEFHKLKEKPRGVNPAAAIKVKKAEDKDSKGKKDHWNAATGGMVDLAELARTLSKEERNAVGKDFASETNTRDEDADMLKYIERKLAARRGVEQLSPTGETGTTGKLITDAATEDLPDILKETGAKSEDLLSSEMLSGIPEVDLGIEVKLRNIEATEEAKQKLLKRMAETGQTEKEISEFVPTNIAVNYVQHTKYNVDAPVPIAAAMIEEAKRLHRVEHIDGEVIEEYGTDNPGLHRI